MPNSCTRLIKPEVGPKVACSRKRTASSLLVRGAAGRGGLLFGDCASVPPAVSAAHNQASNVRLKMREITCCFIISPVLQHPSQANKSSSAALSQGFQKCDLYY